VLVAQKAYCAVLALTGLVTCSSGTFLFVLWLLTGRRLFDPIPMGGHPLRTANRLLISAYYVRLLRLLEKRPNLVAIHLMEADEATTRAKDQTEESKLAGMRGPLARWMLMVEGLFDADLVAACQELTDGMAAYGATDDVTVNRYQLLVSLSE
jgi:hypothetical protein